jgi:hypothetical protein
MIWNHLITVVFIGWIVWLFVRFRKKARNGELIIVPFVSSTLLFALIIPLIIIMDVSTFHLIWLFPVSFVLGVFLLFLPFWIKIVKIFLTVLAK